MKGAPERWWADGDGVGDLRGIAARLDHLAWLGVDALWLSPIYPSPLAHLGYAAHALGLRVLLDFVPCHTSIEHPWFREHPDWYILSPVDGPANNWAAAFGGPAWSPDPESGRWYLHSFYPEQPDLNWRNPQVVAAMHDAIRFWRRRGVDGFRLDAIDRLFKDERLRDEPPAAGDFPLPVYGDDAHLARLYHVHQPETIDALAALRAPADGALLVGEVFQPTAGIARYLDVLDLVFAFELLFAPWQVTRLRAAIEPAQRLRGLAWVLSNHDFDRLATRVGEQNLRSAALVLLTLPGASFVCQGDELGLPNGPSATPPWDRAGRDSMRNPMQWDGGPGAGFTTGDPWLPLGSRPERNAAAQREDERSLLHFYRCLLELRRGLGDNFRFLDTAPDVLAFERGAHVVAVNTSAQPQLAPPLGDVVLETHEDALAAGELAPHAGAIARRRE
ncbi:MAG TPA: alpha-amylase family glycosyl hydrolase [Gaiellaceae bacterium]|nr:alpha-amylase family glycosyl hydrolase [Gaiellaceae bacterium]